MCERKGFAISLSVAALGFTVLLISLLLVTPAHAQSPALDNGNCIKCHEDLYFLHDTGNYYCIREAPMQCVGCHGGNPAATNKESAHYDRSAHPIINDDISKCQECHVDVGECCECISKFDQVAGIKEVKLVSPLPASSNPNQMTGLPASEEPEPVNWLVTLEILLLVVIAGSALTFFVLHKAHHS